MRTLLFSLVLFSCSSAPATPSPASRNHTPRNQQEVTRLVQESAPMILKTFRPRMDFLKENTHVEIQGTNFLVTVEIEYQSFFKPNGRTARISFVLDSHGQTSRCLVQDPIHKAAEVSCSQLETKLSQIFEPSF